MGVSTYKTPILKHKVLWIELGVTVGDSANTYLIWCEENFGKEGQNWCFDPDISKGVYFKNKEDAVAFKLRWLE